MDHHIIIIETATLKVNCVKPRDKEELTKLDDTEDWIIIDPLTNQQFVSGEWIAIPEARMKEFNGIFNLEA